LKENIASFESFDRLQLLLRVMRRAAQNVLNGASNSTTG
jgi:hypothetical protein